MIESENNVKVNYCNYSPYIEERLTVSSRNMQNIKTYTEHLEMKLQCVRLKKNALDRINST